MRAVAAVTAGRGPGLRRTARGSVLVANGVESEPASGKDKMLLSRSPHLVLDGIALAAAAVGANRAYLCLHAGHPGLADQLAGGRHRTGTCRDEPGARPGHRGPRRLRGQPGDGADQLPERRPAAPAFVPPRPFERGVRGRPTLVQNVETLAHLALIARYGADVVPRIGRHAGVGGLGADHRHRRGTRAERARNRARHAGRRSAGTRRAGRPSRPRQCWPAATSAAGCRYPGALNIRISDAGLRAAGAALGPGVLVLLPESACGLAETARARSPTWPARAPASAARA